MLRVATSWRYDAALQYCLHSLLTMGLLLLAGGAARGQTADLNVVATVEASCTVTGGTLDFGAYRSEEGSTGRARISYRCPQDMEISLTLSPGRQPEGRERGMVRDGGDDVLRYQLYRDASRRQVWGDQGDALTIPSTDDGESSVDVFGAIAAGQSVPPGAYRDTVVITLVVSP